MDLSKIRVAVRPRSASEATDLGFVIARHWWRPLMISWLMVALPLSVIFHLLFYQTPWVAGLLIWWFKPLYEQAPLYILSRALFAEKTPMTEVLKNFRTITAKQWFANLTWRRFTPRRSFNAPVSQLEGLSGRERRERIAVLHGSRPSGGWLTFIAVHLELVIYFSLFSLLMIAIPTEMEVDAFQLMQGEGFWVVVLQNALYIIAIATIAPFYVAAGFSLYLHRRIELEAWDIEIDFRKLRQRLERGKDLVMNGSIASASSKVASLLLCFFIWGGSSGDLLAERVSHVDQAVKDATRDNGELTPEYAKQQISGILSDPVFGHEETRKVWRRINEEEKQEKSPGSDLEWLARLVQLIATIGEALLWFFVVLLIGWIVYLYPKWSVWFGLTRRTISKQYQPPETLFGLDVRPESLPEDIAKEVLQSYQDGQPRAALSLLYRATLVQLINHHHMEFQKGATEGECVEIVKQAQHRTGSYFLKLTHTWQAMAYNHQSPDLEEMRALCEQWHDQLHGNIAEESGQ